MKHLLSIVLFVCSLTAPAFAQANPGAFQRIGSSGSYAQIDSNGNIVAQSLTANTFIPGSIGGVLYPFSCGKPGAPSWCSGSDACGYIASAIRALPITGGTVDATGFTGNQACTVNPFSTAAGNGVLLLGFAKFQTTTEWIINSQYSWNLVGSGRKSDGSFLNTTIQAAPIFPANTPVVRMGDGTTAFGQSISNLTVDCNGVTGTTGIYSTDIQEESGVDHVTILNCPNRGFWMNGSGNDGTGPDYSENYYVRDLYVLPLSAATPSTIACEFDGRDTPFHELVGTTCGGSPGHPSGIGFLFDGIYGGFANNLNAEDVEVGYQLGNKNSVFGLNLSGIQGSTDTQAVIRMKSTDTSIVLTGVINGGGFAPETIDDPGHLSTPITDFSVGLYVVGSQNLNNGFVPVVSSSPVVPAKFTALSLNNGMDANNTLFINSGKTVASGAAITFEDRGLETWSLAVDPTQNFEVFNNANNFQVMGAQEGGNGNASLRAQGTGGINFNEIAGSGTNGVSFYSGGATPTPVASITGGTGSTSGCLLQHTTSICSGAGAPTSSCGTSPNGNGSLWMRTDGTSTTTLYVCGGNVWTPK